MQEIQEKQIVSKAEMEQAVAKVDQPFVVRELLKDLPLVKLALEGDDAILEFLMEKSKPVNSVFMVGDQKSRNNLGYDEELAGKNYKEIKMPLLQALQLLQKEASEPSGKLVRVQTYDIDEFFNDMDLSLAKNIYGVEKARRPMLWMGNSHTVPAHYDPFKNFVTVVAGSRKFTLFPLECIQDLYIGPIDSAYSRGPVSMVDMVNPDYGKHPLYSNAEKRGQCVTLFPGDVLYMPAYWYHHVQLLENFNILLINWWGHYIEEMLSPMDAMTHAMMEMVAFSPEERRAWKVLYDYYVFSEDSSRFDHIPEKARGILGPKSPRDLKQFKYWLAKKLCE